MNLRSLVGDIVAVVGLDGELRPVGVELAETANGRHPLLGRGTVGQVDLVLVGLELVAGRWRRVEGTAGRNDARAGLLDFVEVDRLGFGLGFGRRGRLRFELFSRSSIGFKSTAGGGAVSFCRVSNVLMTSSTTERWTDV